MQKRIIAGIGSESLVQLLKEKGIQITEDIPYQEGILEYIAENPADLLLLSDDLQGEEDKYFWIEKLLEVRKEMQIVMILTQKDESYKKFLYKKGIYDVFIDGESSLEDLCNAITKETVQNVQKLDLRQKIVKLEYELEKEKRKAQNGNMKVKIQKQQVITFAGLGSTGKSTILTQMATFLAKNSASKVLVIDFDVIHANLHQFFGVNREPEHPAYILPQEKNSSLNYMIDAIDKKSFDSALFEKYLVKSKQFPNLSLLTGNRSIPISRSVLNQEYYKVILEKAKELYDFILIDVSSNIFVDAMQFAMVNSNKIFMVAEATYLSVERTYRFMKEFLPVWDIPESKIEVLVNKYHKKSLDKNIINEIFKDICVAGYISFSEDYDDALNSGTPYLLQEEKEYAGLMQKFHFVPKENLLERLKANYWQRMVR
ncbi:MAG: AAA family ATPase [Clostridia bacterium]|nr:AAA family ATPase [Clostridia bacterium]